MQTDLQQLKALGYLPNVSLDVVAKGDEAARAANIGFEEIQVLQRDCGHPDHADPEIAAADPEDLTAQLGLSPDNDCEHARHLSSLHRRMGEYNNQKWPAGCHADHSLNEHVVKVYVEWDKFPVHNMRLCTGAELQQIVDAKVWGWTIEEVRAAFAEVPMAKVALALAFEAYRRLGCLHVEINDGPNGSEHQIHIKPVPIPGNVIGVGWFPNGSCNDHVNQHIDTIQFGLMGLARLFAHELGHNHGEQHQFQGQSSHRSVMSYNPPRLFYGFLTGNEGILPRDRSRNSLDEKYGGKPVGEDPVKGGPTDPVEPVEPPTRPNRVVHSSDYFENGKRRTVTITEGLGTGGGVWG